MSTTSLTDSNDFIYGKAKALLPWFIVLVGLCFMYIPTFINLFLQGVWGSTEQAHGPIVFAISLWLIYRKWPEILAARVEQKKTVVGWFILVVGLLFYIVGRSQNVYLLEVSSLIWLLLSIGLILLGTRSVKVAWFPLFFMLFMIPLPGIIVDAITMPMKIAVSYVAEQVLYGIGYPIARSGVILQIGQYQLLVADACAGLHTLFTLESLGLLYLNLVRHESFNRNLVLAILIVPISFSANVIRVMVLTLITYYFGDAAGQGFLHGFAGMVLFLSALLLIIAADALVRVLFTRKSITKQPPC
ncbi:MAG: exosortase B [Betaproteobacteria bacterium]|nr:exosortase B [Betaproteobacteria bacterium]